MLVTIVAVPNADNTGLGPDRVEKVEDLHPDVARPMLDLGTARLPSDDELAAYRRGQPDGEARSGAMGAQDALAKARTNAAAQARDSAKSIAQAESDVRAARPSKASAPDEPPTGERAETPAA
jgi:hypothetical protein